MKIITAMCFTIAVIVCGIYTLHFGIPLVDESYFISISYRFALGGHPFINEYVLSQLASFFPTPFLKYFLFKHGSSDGIVLFSRYIYFCFTILFASTMVLITKKIMDLRAAILFSLLCVAFVFCNMYALNYNTQAIMFATLGYFLGILAVLKFNAQERYVNLMIFLAGLSHAEMVVSYPTLFLVPLLFLFGLMYFLPKQKTLIFYGAGLFIGGIWLLPILIHTRWYNLYHIDWPYTKTIHMVTTFQKLASWVTKKHWIYIVILLLLLLLSLFFLTLFIYRARENKKIKLILPYVGPIFLLTLLVPAALSVKNWNSAAVILISSVAMLAPLLYFLVRNENPNLVRQLFILVWTPSVFAGIITTFSSDDAIWSSPVGLFSAALVSLFYMMLLGNKKSVSHIETHKYPINFSFVALLPLMLLIIILQYYDLKFTFQDLPISLLHSKVEIGPFKGLYTTEESKIYYTQLTRDIKSISEPSKTVLYENFCPGPLFSTMHTIQTGDRLFAIKHHVILNANTQNPTLIVRILSLPVSGPNTEVTPFSDDFLTKKYRVLIRKKGYEIFERI